MANVHLRIPEQTRWEMFENTRNQLRGSRDAGRAPIGSEAVEVDKSLAETGDQIQLEL